MMHLILFIIFGMLCLAGAINLLPTPHNIVLVALLPVFWFVVKVLFFLFLYIWVRGTMPRFRYDQLMGFGWKFLLPLAILNVLGTSLAYALH